MNTLFPSLSKIAKNSLLLITFLFATLLISSTAIAQTNPYVKIGQSLLNCTRGADACPANDLQVLDLFLGGINDCVTCTPGQTVTGTLSMRIDNTTGSVRTSFALFGTLSSGAKLTYQGVDYTGNIFICVGPVDITKGINTFVVGTISFTCGQAVTLTNNYLAYTPANGTTQAICDVLAGAKTCQDIRPKCGVAASITIRTPVTATPSTASQPCTGSTTGGSINVIASGGVPGYTIDIFKQTGGSCPAAIPSKVNNTNYVTTLTVATSGGDATTGTNLAEGTYCIYTTDSKGCTAVTSHTILGKACCVNPGKPTICQVRPSACGTETKVTLRVSSLTASSDYHVKQGGTEIAGSPQPSSAAVNGVLTFTLNPGGGTLEVYGTQTISGTTCTGSSATCSDLTECSQQSARIANEVQTQEIKLEPAPSKVQTIPNPFNDKIKFSLNSTVSGMGSLDLYNMLGQKVKTVYQGRFEKGKVQVVEYNVPATQRTNLVYVFTVGDQRTTGKLIGVK
jgi:hypothetical protein